MQRWCGREATTRRAHRWTKEAFSPPRDRQVEPFLVTSAMVPSGERHDQNSSRGRRWWPDLVLPCLCRWDFWLKPRPHSAHT